MSKISKKQIQASLKNIRIIISDVDGVLTDGKIRFDSKGKEIKIFHSTDSFRAEAWLKSGGKILLFTGRKAIGTQVRAKELGLDLLFKQDLNEDLFSYIRRIYGLEKKQALYIGDDWNDLYFMSQAGLAVSPQSGRKENIAVSHIVTRSKGGEGVLSEVVEIAMKAQGTWEKTVNNYLKKFIL